MKSRKNEVLLILGKWTSKVGDVLFDYINTVTIVHYYTSTPLILALYQSAETVINVIFNIIGGTSADRGSKKKILIVTDILSAGVCFLLSCFAVSKHLATALIIANALLALMYSFNSPSYKAIAKQAVAQERLRQYNSISQAGAEIIKIAGPFLGLGLMRIVGINGALLINGATFILSAYLEFFIFVPQPAYNASECIKTSFFLDVVDGFRYLFREKYLLCLIVLSALVNFFLAGYNLLVPYTNVYFEAIDENFYSKVIVAQTLGGLAGSLLNTSLLKRRSLSVKLLINLLATCGVFLFVIPVFGYTQNMIGLLFPFCGFFAALTLYNINFISYVQAIVSENYLGRVFSIIFTVAVMFMPIGSLVFSTFLTRTTTNTFTLVGAGIIFLALISHFLFDKLNKNRSEEDSVL